MPGLRRRLWAERHDDDRGAVATVFVILLAGGVLLGFLALVIDVGQIHVEREELQGGADAAVLAVARACAVNATDCASGAAMTRLAQRYADENASDGRSQVSVICGRLADRAEDYPAPAGNLADCLGERPAGTAPYVEVHLTTEVAGGQLVLPPVFAQSMAGNAGYTGTSVGACARATWTPATEVSIVALTMSECDYAEATPVPPTTPPAPSDERVVELVPGHADCAGDPPGPWLPAGPASWLAGDANCQVRMPAGADLTGAVGTPPGCPQRLRQARDSGEVVYIPLHDRVSGTSADRSVHPTRLAPFLVTGWRIDESPTGPSEPPAASEPPAEPGGPVCGDPGRRCVAGIFVAPPVPVSQLAGGTALVTLVG